jgi:hypothetical protein
MTFAFEFQFIAGHPERKVAVREHVKKELGAERGKISEFIRAQGEQKPNEERRRAKITLFLRSAKNRARLQSGRIAYTRMGSL